MNNVQKLVKQADNAIDSFNQAQEELEKLGYNVGLSRPFHNKLLLKINKKRL